MEETARVGLTVTRSVGEIDVATGNPAELSVTL